MTVEDQPAFDGSTVDDTPPTDEQRQKIKSLADQLVLLELCLAYSEMREKRLVLLLMPPAAVFLDALVALESADLALGALTFVLVWVSVIALI